MWRRAGCIAMVIVAGAGCGSSKGSGGADASGGTGGPGGADAQVDSTGSEPYVPDYYIGDCSFFGGGNGTVPAEGSPLHGLTVIASGLTGMVALEVDATNAYLASASTISRLPLAGGAAQVMVTNAKPVATASDANNIYWLDAGVSGKTTVLSAPLTATGLDVMAGAASSRPTQLASQTGAPGAFTMAGGTLAFAAGNVVWRVPTSGGAAQMVYSGLAPTGIAIDGDNFYLGDDPNEAIQFVSISGSFPGVLQGFTFSEATPTQLAASNGTLYWGDWFGLIEHAPVANANALAFAKTPCGGAGCYPNHLRPSGGGAVWEAGDSTCSSVGTVDASGAKYFAVDISVVGGIAVAGSHLYAVTKVGQLLRFDL